MKTNACQKVLFQCKTLDNKKSPLSQGYLLGDKVNLSVTVSAGKANCYVDTAWGWVLVM